MLTRAQSRSIDGFTVYRDFVLQGGIRAFTTAFYILPDRPRIAMDQAGGPAFDFLWYRRPPEAPEGTEAPGGTGAHAGGIVTVTVELSPAPEERAMLEASLPTAYALEELGQIQLRPLPCRGGTVALTYAGEAAGGEFVEHIAGTGPARMAGNERATFVIELTQDGAALLWQAIQEGQDLFHIRYDLLFDEHLDDVKLRVWCDVETAMAAAAEMLAAGPVDPGHLRTHLMSRRLAGFELVTERPLSPEDRAALDELGQSLLEAALGNAMLGVGSAATGVGGAIHVTEGDSTGLQTPGGLRPLLHSATEMQVRLNHTFTQSVMVERHAVVEDVLRLGFETEALAHRVRRVDLVGGFFRVLEIMVLCTVDFRTDAIEAVKATFEYASTGPDVTVRRTAELLFREGAVAQTVRFDLASPDQRSYRYRVDVHYRGDPDPVRLAETSSDETIVVLDLDGLGVLRVEVELRDVPFDMVRSAVVDLEYPSGQAHRLILDGQRPSGSWQAVVRETPRPYRYRVAWVTVDRRLEGEWLQSATRRLTLDAPVEVRAGRVIIVSAGDFSELAQLVVDLRTEAGSGEVQSLSFTAPGQSSTWDPSGGGVTRYQVRTSMVYRDGTVHLTDWKDDDRPVLVVRDHLRFDVQVIPRLLDVGGAVALVLVELELVDEAAGLHERGTLVVRSPDEEPMWSVRLAAVDRHDYRYRLTLVPFEGPRRVGTWQEARESVLVLRPEEE